MKRTSWTLLTTIAVCGFAISLGVAIGILWANAGGSPEIDITQARNGFAVQFFESAVKYGKTLMVIWLLGFLPKIAPIGCALISFKGMSLGFTAVALIHNDASSALSRILAFTPQSLLVLAAYVYVFYRAVNFEPTGNDIGIKQFLEYAAWFVIGLVFIALASAAEVFLSPMFIK